MPNDRSRDVAVVGSPSTNTELTVDLLQEATEERLVGALTAFEAVQNGQRITSVGQIVGIELKNRWHEDSVFRNNAIGIGPNSLPNDRPPPQLGTCDSASNTTPTPKPQATNKPNNGIAPTPTPGR